ncbi:MAG: DUF975 family protein [Clostridia bacterium]|nr:DUF975 family protein [Clostridia bacterium]
MKYAADFRKTARTALKGRWGTAVIAGLIAGLVGAVTLGSSNFKYSFDDNGFQGRIRYLARDIYSFSMDAEAFGESFGLIMVAAALIALAVLFIKVFLGSVVNVGYSKFQLELMDEGKQPEVGTLFQYFPFWKNAVLTMFLKSLYMLLWFLLFLFPGIIAAYSYAMTGYILAENPNLPAREAIRKSKAMMQGNRTRLFCLHFSFIGWSILSSLTFGIGNLWLTPYRKAAEAAFYLDLKNGQDSSETK